MMSSAKIRFRSILSILAVIVCVPLLSGQDDVVERVEVLNREVLVRVFHGGEPVSGLSRQDFSLTENGKPVRVTSFREVRRALSPRMQSHGVITDNRHGRLFLFLLWWNEESRDWDKAWDYFLNNIFRPGDRVLLSGGGRVLQLRDPRKEVDQYETFLREANKQLALKKLRKQALANQLLSCTRDFHNALLENAEKKAAFKTPEQALLNEFKNRYRGILDDYRLTRLRAQPETMRQLAVSLRALEVEKWALLFMQNERLPMLHRKSRLFTDAPMGQATIASLRSFVDDCDRKMRLASDMAVHAMDLRSLFIGAGATFHLFLSDPREETNDSDQLRWLPVFSSWESAFRDISRDTGGDVQDTLKLATAMESAATRPDIYYVLTFRPSSPDVSRGDLKIGMIREELEAVYARKLTARDIRPLRISDPVFDNGTLRFDLFDYLRETVDAASPAGDIHILVRAERAGGEPLEFEKILRPESDSAQVSLGVRFPSPGDYILSVAARDRLSGNSARGHTRVSIAPPPEPEEVSNEVPADPRLQAIMDRAAVYSSRLQRAVFRFTCTEWVEETILERNPLSRRVEKSQNQWRYDYQVVGEGSITEQRRMLWQGRKRVNIENARLSTRFAARYSAFMPVTLMGKQNRHAYHYRLLEACRITGRSCAVIEVTPRKKGFGPLAQGKVYVDLEDGSIIKIEMFPQGVKGSRELAAEAEKISAKLDLSVTHWYLEQRRGLRFPSKTVFSESYVFDKQIGTRRLEIPYKSETHSGRATIINVPYIEARRRRVEFYRLSQEYKDYRYFEVSSSVEVENTD